MNSIVIGLVVLSALMHAFRDFLTKKSNDKQVFVWMFHLSSLIFFLPIFIYFLATNEIKLIGVYISMISGTVIFFYWYFLTKSYAQGDLSHTYPIMRSAPVLVLMFAIIFLNEQVSFLGILGILFVVFGAYIINMKRISLSEVFEPIKKILKDRSTQFAFLTLISVSIYSIIDKIGVSYLHPVIYVYLIIFFPLILFTPYVFYVKDKITIIKEWKINKKTILISGFLMIFGYLLILFAFTLERVSYVIGLRQLSVIFAVLLGIYILKEKYKAVKILAATLIFIGTFLISIAQ